MARLALGRPLKCPVEICDGTASCDTFPFLCSGLQTDIYLFSAVDTSLQASELIADSVKRSSSAHVFHFYALLCEIVSVPRKAPSAWIMAEHFITSAPVEPAGKDKGPAEVHARRPLSRVATGGMHSPGPGHLVSLDARALARQCLREVGRELGVPR